ncbi:MAG TPA: hypothetical protein VNX15_11980 [Gemmatimonadales bacterium]|jgi:hypothetical protein|nr:hypothetical protein [Gemmatimonadales bacterium]
MFPSNLEQPVFSGSLFRRAALVSGLVLTAFSAAAAQAPAPDPRVGLKAGVADAGQAAWNMRLVSATARPAGFFDAADLGDFGFMDSDLAFDGKYVIQGNFAGVLIWDVSNPAQPALVTSLACPGWQNDVSVYRHLLFVSVESTDSHQDCSGAHIQDTVSADRVRGVRIFDITDIQHPKIITNVQTCRGSHTHTLVTDPKDTANVYIYVSGSSFVRSPNELAGCSSLDPAKDPNSEQFRIEVIRVPLAHPEQAKVVNKPAILTGLMQAGTHPEAAVDLARQKQRVDSARAAGGFIVKMDGSDRVVGPRFIRPLLDSIVKARDGTGVPTAADTAALRAGLQGIVDAMMGVNNAAGPRPGPVQCHDITVYPAIGRAGGACGGYGLLLDISDPAHPRRLAAVADSNFSFWHSATFSNDGSMILFSDEWGGGLAPRCRATDDPRWGADALFRIKDSTLTFQGYYKMPAAQTEQENCVAHNGSLIPVPGRTIMAQGWYQGGVSVFDWTDPAHPKEIAFFDRGPMDSTKLVSAGSWSAYWYNGVLVSSEIGRGLDIFELTPNALLTQNEIDAAKLVHVAQQNVQDQQKTVWPSSPVVAQAYLDQLARSGMTAAQVSETRSALAKAEKATGAARKTALTKLASQLNTSAAAAGDPAKVRALAAVVTGLANAKP